MVTVIVQDILSGDVLGSFSAVREVVDSYSDKKSIDLGMLLGTGSGETVEPVELSYARDSTYTALMLVKPSSYKGVSEKTAQFPIGSGKGFMYKLEDIVEDRRQRPNEGSFTSMLFHKGDNLILSTLLNNVGEMALEGKDGRKTKYTEKAADVLYHFIVSLAAQGIKVSEVEEVLLKRHRLLHG